MSRSIYRLSTKRCIEIAKQGGIDCKRRLKRKIESTAEFESRYTFSPETKSKLSDDSYSFYVSEYILKNRNFYLCM